MDTTHQNALVSAAGTGEVMAQVLENHAKERAMAREETAANVKALMEAAGVESAEEEKAGKFRGLGDYLDIDIDFDIYDYSNAASATLSAFGARFVSRAFGSARSYDPPGGVSGAARSSVVLLIFACLVSSAGAADTHNSNKVQTSVNGFFPSTVNPAAPYQRLVQTPRTTTTQHDRESLLNTQAPELRT
jgi:hypothetical protein